MSKQVVLEVLRQLLAKIGAEIEKCPTLTPCLGKKTSVRPITTLSVGEPTSQSSHVDHFQSVALHFWINHLSLDPKIFFFKNLILERIKFNTWS